MTNVKKSVALNWSLGHWSFRGAPRRVSPRLLKKTQMQGGTPEAGYPVRWVQAYWKYVAASAEADQRSRWAFFSSLLSLPLARI